MVQLGDRIPPYYNPVIYLLHLSFKNNDDEEVEYNLDLLIQSKWESNISKIFVSIRFWGSDLR